jgi:metallo-beta-lactamase class B
MKFWVAVLLAVVCSSAFAQKDEYAINVHRVDTNVFVYHFTIKVDTLAIEANGLIVEGKDSVVVVETPWDLTQTIQLINWVMGHLKKPIGLVIVTHTHPDRLGGLSIMLSDRFPVYGSVLTAQEAVKNGFRPPDYQFLNDTTFHCSGLTVETFYPGSGHIQGNVLVYFSGPDVLVGGSFLKSAKAISLGPVGDTDVGEWLQSLQRLKEKYPHPKIVVPGNGSWEAGAIETTEKLLQDAVKKKPAAK